MKLLRRIRYLLSRGRAEQDLQAEMSAHRQMLAADRRTSFGSDLKLREESRDVWGFVWLDQLRQDLAFGARQMRRSPGFTLMAVTVLALGVGLNLAVFQIANAVFYDRISVRDSPLLQRLIRQSPARKLYAFPAGIAGFYRENASQFAYLVTEHAGTVPVSFENDPANVRAQFVSANYFQALAVAPLRGRLIQPSDANPGDGHISAVLSYGYWQRRFGGDASVFQRPVYVNRKPVQVVGIAPVEFDGLTQNHADLWLPEPLRPRLVEGASPGDEYRRPDTALFGVFKPGVSAASAGEQLRALAAEMRAQHPNAFEDNEGIRAQPLGDDERRFGSFVFLIPMVFLILLASCANLGNMLLARGLTRAREIEARIAVGAGRWRVVRQLMTESLLLAACGAIAGLFVARFGARLYFVGFSNFARYPDVRIVTGWSVILAAAGLAVFSTLAFGLAPAIAATRGGRPPTGARRTLLAFQVAVSSVLLICSGLLARGAQRLTASGSRMDFEKIVMIEPGLESANLTGSAARQALDGLARRLSQVPGVAAVTIASGAPIFGVRVQNAPGLPTTFWQSVDPSYFGLMQIPITRGRNFLPNEPATNMIISEAAARFRWPKEDPLGKHWGSQGDGPAVVGVVADTEATAFRNASAIEAYTPMQDKNAADAVLILRTTGDPGAQLQNMRAVATLPGTTPWVSRLQSQVDRWIEHAGSATRMITALGGTGSFLAAIGVFGLIAFSVAERTREIGLRIALGAGPRGIVRALFAQYTGPLLIGAAVGIALAYALVLSIQSQIILGLTTFDPLGYLPGLAGFLVILVVAVLIPVRRALRIDPASALRWE
ncbi:MAG TPA: FtsX-like permease family protein [Bryobacteraceae bacterium]|nr:FtsX-like permease family protein [Bryobacteraceae bacterium]